MAVEIVITSSDNYNYKWGEIVDGIKFYALSQPQLEVLASPAKYTFAFAGSGGGKTCLLPLAIYKKLCRHKKKSKDFYRVLLVSPTVSTFKKSQLKQHLIDVFKDTIYEGVWKGTDGIYEGPGFEIVVSTAENDPARLSGGQYDDILVDEAWQTSSEVWEEVRRRSNIKDAPVLVVTTPNVDGWLWEEFQAWEAGCPTHHCVTWATNQNPVKSPEEYAKFLDDELKKIGQARFDRLYGGLFSRLTGLVYPSFSDVKSSEYPVVPAFEIFQRPVVRAAGCIDWGYAPDPTAAYPFVETDDGIIYIVEEIYNTKLQIDWIGRKLRQLQEKWSIDFESPYKDIIKGGNFEAFYCDSSRPESRDMVGRFGVSIQNRKIPSIEAGIAIVDQMFRVGRLKIFDTCVNLIRELRNYSWKDKGNLPKPGNDHSCDSLRYGISSYMQGKPITLLPDEAVPMVNSVTHNVDTAVRLGHAKCEIDLVKMQEDEQLRKQLAWQAEMESMEV